MAGCIQDRTLALARELIRIPSYTGEEQSIAQFVRDYLVKHDIHATVDQNNNVVATAGDPQNRPALLLNGHLDTVPANDIELWSYDPFAGDVREGRLYGRGACDMKGGLAAMMVALCEHAPMARNGVIFTAVACEEASAAAERSKGIQSLIRMGVCESIDYALVAEPTSCRLSTGHPGRSILQLQVQGRSSHAAMADNGINAVWHLVRMLHRIESDLTKRDQGNREMTSTFTFGPIQGGVTANVVPDRAEIAFDARSSDRAWLEETLGLLRQSCDKHLGEHARDVSRGLSYTLEQIGWREPVGLDDKSDRSFAQFIQETLNLPERESIQNRFCTDASFIQPMLNIPVLLLGPGNEEMAHQPDEFVEVEQLGRCAEQYMRILTAFSERKQRKPVHRSP